MYQVTATNAPIPLSLWGQDTNVSWRRNRSAPRGIIARKGLTRHCDARQAANNTDQMGNGEIMTSVEIAEIVDNIYTNYLDHELPDDWTPTQRRQFLDDRAAAISRQILVLADEMAARAIAEWTGHHNGQHPDYLTHVGLINTTRLQAKEIVLHNELYEQIPDTDDEQVISDTDLYGDEHIEYDRVDGAWRRVEPPRPADYDQTPSDQRWTRPRYRTDPTTDLEALIAKLWPQPQHSAWFQIKAGYLLAARAEDGLPLPTGPEEPLAVQLAQMVNNDLRHDGLP